MPILYISGSVECRIIEARLRACSDSRKTHYILAFALLNLATLRRFMN